MRRLKLEAGTRALVIVAHPDDETIWLGGTILLNPKVHWTIFCLSRKSDKDRRPKFVRACVRFGAEAIMTDLDDTGKLSLQDSIPIVKRLLSLKLRDRSFEYCFTHGANGEYGHASHIGVHRAVIEWEPREKLNLKRFFVFNYEKLEKETISSMTMKEDSDYYVKLSNKMFKEKKMIQSKVHGYIWNGIDNKLCTKTEGFKIIK